MGPGYGVSERIVEVAGTSGDGKGAGRTNLGTVGVVIVGNAGSTALVAKTSCRRPNGVAVGPGRTPSFGVDVDHRSCPAGTPPGIRGAMVATLPASSGAGDAVALASA